MVAILGSDRDAFLQNLPEFVHSADRTQCLAEALIGRRIIRFQRNRPVIGGRGPFSLLLVPVGLPQAEMGHRVVRIQRENLLKLFDA